MSDFVIENGVLTKYQGPGGDVVIPEGVTGIGGNAFFSCSGLLTRGILTSVTLPESLTSIGDYAFYDCVCLTGITIPEGVTYIGRGAFLGCQALTSVTIPDSVKSTGNVAFLGCTGLQDEQGFVVVRGVLYDYVKKDAVSVTIPESVKRIGDSAFSECKSLTSVVIPNGVTIIGDNAFKECGSLTSVTIPDGVTSIGRRAFYGCKSLLSVTVPDGVKVIEDWTFCGCNHLKRVTLPGSVERVGRSAFSGCTQLRDFSMGNWRAEMAEDVFDKSRKVRFPPEGVASFLLFRSQKEFVRLAEGQLAGKNADAVVRSMADILRGEEKVGAKLASQAVETAMTYAKDIKPETIGALADVLREKKCKQALAMLQYERPSQPAADDAAKAEEIRGIEALVKSNWTADKTAKTLRGFIKEGVPYAGSATVSSPEAVIFVVGAYASQQEWTKSRLGFLYAKIMPLADQVAAALDRKALLTLLERLVYVQGKYLCIPALARYSGEKQAARLIEEHEKLRAWKTAGKAALLLSETKTAMLYMEKLGRLNIYARTWGTDVEAVRDKMMLDFGLDETGKKMYDLGGRTVSASVGPDLKVTLFDETAGRAVRSLPKKDTDPAKLAAASDDLAEMKKNIKKVVRARTDTLLEQFRSGRRQKAEKWRELYLSDAVLRGLARLVVWNQGRATFTLGPDGPIQSDGAAYALTDALIAVAHPMEMDPAEVSAWQDYFVANGLKQPFEQVWEPVTDPKTIRPERYEGCKLPKEVFYQKEKHGIKYSPDYDFGYTATDSELQLYGCELSWEYDGTNDDEIMLGKFSFHEYTRQVNHIVALLDRWTVAGRILKDDVTVREQLDGFTAAQIMEYIRLASENSCPNCAAMLLEYKQAHYPDFDPMAEFTLE